MWHKYRIAIITTEVRDGFLKFSPKGGKYIVDIHENQINFLTISF